MNVRLIPVPKSETPRDGVFDPATGVTVWAPNPCDDRLRRAVERFADSLPFSAAIGTASDNRRAKPPIRLTLRHENSESQRYSLDITPRDILIAADGPAGVFYGLVTLSRIADLEGTQWRCRSIEDGPDLTLRGMSFDVTRGKMPTMDTLLRIVNRLAAVKINHLQLYVEHTFDFRFDPDIARGCSALTHDDIARLDAYCRDRFIELTPSLACFGHMGRILSLPKYQSLAEIPCERSWEHQPWLERLRGLTINPRDPESRRLLNNMLDEYLPLFSNGWANVCADETHDLGRGANRLYCERAGRGRLYVDHLRFLADACRRHGRRMMFWGDVIRSFPELIDELPHDAIVLDWGYDADSEFPITASPHRGERSVCVCPGTNGWNRVINGMATADANIDNAVAAATEHAARGLMVTDWGDHGHFNLLACSIPAIVRAAARAWNATATDPASLNGSIERCVFGADSDGVLSALRDVGRLSDSVQTWPALYKAIDDPQGAARIDPNTARAHGDIVESAMEALDELPDSSDKTEWRLACRGSALVAQKAIHAHAIVEGNAPPRKAMSALADDIAAFGDDYEEVWRARNRSRRLDDVVAALRATVADISPDPIDL